MRRLSPILVLALLAACGEEPPVDDSRAASGEVLEGTISDAMLPVDRVRSQPPLAEPEGQATGGAPAQAASAAQGAAEESEAAPEDEPAADDAGEG